MSPAYHLLSLSLFTTLNKFAIAYNDGSYVQVSTHGDVDYCNSNPSQYTITPLSTSDEQYVSNLRQIQIITRHGSRTTESSLSDYFSSELVSEYDMKFNCNVTTKTNRIYNNNNDNFINLNKKYVLNEQLVEGNCQAGQTVHELINQHKINGKHVYNAYFGPEATIGVDTSFNLMSDTVLYEIFDTIKQNGYDERFALHSTDYERTLASALVLVSSLFEELGNSSELEPSEINQVLDGLDDIVMDVLTHDADSSPYLALGNNEVGTELFTYLYSILADSDYYAYWSTDDVVAARSKYAEITNVSFSMFSVVGYLPAYCANIKIPLNATLFDTLLNISDELVALFWHNDYNLYNATFTPDNDRYQAFRVDSSSMRYLISQYLQNATSTNSDPNEYQVVYHSAHDTTILSFLGGIGASDGTWPIFAEMLILEIYEADTLQDNILNIFPSGYAFRLLRNGKSLLFKNCTNLIEQYNMELCDLNVILEYLNKDAMYFNDWEIWAESYLSNYSSSTTTTSTGTDTNGNNNGGGSVMTTKDGDDNDCGKSGSNDASDKDIQEAMVKGALIGVGATLGVSCIVLVVYCCVLKKRERKQPDMYSQF